MLKIGKFKASALRYEIFINFHIFPKFKFEGISDKMMLLRLTCSHYSASRFTVFYNFPDELRLSIRRGLFAELMG